MNLGKPMRSMMADQLTALLGQRIMGWRFGPERILKGGRRWMPRWQFQPLQRSEHAIQLLDKANAQYRLTKAEDGTYTAEVLIDHRRGKASGKSEAATVTLALAHALQIDLPDRLLETAQQ